VNWALLNDKVGLLLYNNRVVTFVFLFLLFTNPVNVFNKKTNKRNVKSWQFSTSYCEYIVFYCIWLSIFSIIQHAQYNGRLLMSASGLSMTTPCGDYLQTKISLSARRIMYVEWLFPHSNGPRRAIRNLQNRWPTMSKHSSFRQAKWSSLFYKLQSLYI